MLSTQPLKLLVTMPVTHLTYNEMRNAVISQIESHSIMLKLHILGRHVTVLLSYDTDLHV